MSRAASHVYHSLKSRLMPLIIELYWKAWMITSLIFVKHHMVVLEERLRSTDMDEKKESIFSIIRSRYWREKILNTLLITAFVIVGISASTTYPEPNSYIVLSIPIIGFLSYMVLLYIDVRIFSMRLMESKRRGSKHVGGVK